MDLWTCLAELNQHYPLTIRRVQGVQAQRWWVQVVGDDSEPVVVTGECLTDVLQEVVRQASERGWTPALRRSA